MQDRRTLLLGQKEAQERAKQLKRASNKAPHTCPAIPRHSVGRCVVLASTLSGLWLIDGGRQSGIAEKLPVWCMQTARCPTSSPCARLPPLPCLVLLCGPAAPGSHGLLCGCVHSPG